MYVLWVPSVEKTLINNSKRAYVQDTFKPSLYLSKEQISVCLYRRLGDVLFRSRCPRTPDQSEPCVRRWLWSADLPSPPETNIENFQIYKTLLHCVSVGTLTSHPFWKSNYYFSH